MKIIKFFCSVFLCLLSCVTFAQSQSEMVDEYSRKIKGREATVLVEVEDIIDLDKQFSETPLRSLIEAKINCESRPEEKISKSQAFTVVSYLKSKNENTLNDVIRHIASIERKFQIAKQNSEAACYDGSNTKFDSHIRCMSSIHINNNVANIKYGASRINISYSSINKLAKEYLTCAEANGVNRETVGRIEKILSAVDDFYVGREKFFNDAAGIWLQGIN